jgi:hypothetical protein
MSPLLPTVLPQHFIQRAGPEILVRDLPPKQETLLALAPTPSQLALLHTLMDILKDKGRSLFRDIEVGRSLCMRCKRRHLLVLFLAAAY